ncbi:MAG: thioredoxin family protein [Hyphomicrobiaceae bacterium]|nr:MAG: thioredoxin family protein [Hyphomicrobiaceae bacterium]
MLTRRTLLKAAACAACAAGLPAVALGGGLFTQAAFEAAQKAGRPILVDISASWCSTCKAQKPILSALSKSETFKDFVMLEVDFDSQKDVVRALKARNQSTLIVFKGINEVGRSVGDTDPDSIEALLSKAL